MKIFGLIGYPLGHSFSKKYFEEKFLLEEICDSNFELFSIPSIDLLPTLLAENNEIKGFAVTIPYKKEVIKYLDVVDEVVLKIGACNCVKIENGLIKGFNTDVIGFEKSFSKLLKPHHKKALILGTGGAAAAVEFVLQKLDIDYVFVSRTKHENSLTYNEIGQQLLQEYTLIINTTPVGTFPNVDESPCIPYEFLNASHLLFDLVYNPNQTEFMKQGSLRNSTVSNGYEMLVLQAEENWKIWNS